MRRLLVFAGATVAAVVAAGAGAAVARATPTCSTGYSYSQYQKNSLASTLSANIIAQAAWTPSGEHVAGYISVGTAGGGPWIQTGILDGSGGAPQFYIEENGATNPPPTPPWVHTAGGTDGVYINQFGAPVLGTAYGFQIMHTDTDKFEAVAPGFTSRIFTFPSGMNFSAFTNEVYANGSTCPTSEFEFTNPSPWNFGLYSYSAFGADPSYFDEWLNSLTDWVSDFPVDCQPVQCQAPITASDATSSAILAPPSVPPTG